MLAAIAEQIVPRLPARMDVVLRTSARLLRLLSLLQARRDWSGPELAARLDVTTRTVRNDVERLRSLGYPIQASPGVAGGYRLGAGTSLPPLLLDDDEAVAVAIGLRTAASGSVAGLEETSVRALAKLEQVLPPRLRHRVNTLQTYTVPVPDAVPAVDARALAAIAAACRDHERLRFDYLTHERTPGERTVEPHRLAFLGRRWYLEAWDTGRAGWRTFRVDRMRLHPPTGRRFVPRQPPEGDVASRIARGVGQATWRYRARVTVLAPAETVRARLPPAIPVEPLDERRCVVDVGSDSPHMLAVYLGLLDADFEVTEPAELVEHLRRLVVRYDRATRPSRRS
jgi:predicted DNA-binding transcriptional regulator YafY